MLEEKKIAHRFRDTGKEPLSQAEVKTLLQKLGVPAREVLRKQDKAYKELGITGEETPNVLIGHLAKNPGLMARPIGVKGKKAVLGRPPETLLEL